MTFRSSILIFGLLAALTPLRAQDKPKKSDPATASQILSLDPLVAPDAHSKAPDNIPPGSVPSGIAQMVAQFFVSLQKNDVDGAYANLTKGSKIAEKPQEIKQLKAKTTEAIDVFGAIFGYDLVDSKSVGSRLVRSTYASHGKIYPLRWRFYFYKPDDTWLLIDMRVDDKLSGMFDEPEDPKNTEAKP